MPHQCLKCGLVFEEGSSQLLKGCPDCGGNRFFFTKEPLGEKERNEMTKKVGKDINETIMEILGEENGEVLNNSGKWIKIKSKDVRKALEQHLPEKKITANKKEDIDKITNDEFRKNIIKELESGDNSDAPETIDVERPGKYRIDLKGLLEEEPIIIQKDGSYTIHLPSIFKMIDKKE